MLLLPLGNGNKSNDSLMKSGKTSEYKLKMRHCNPHFEMEGTLVMFLEL